MNWSLWMLAGWLAIAPLGMTARGVAQGTLPGEPQQNDRRSAIARIDPKKPIQIRVVSQTTLPVVTSTVAAAGDRPLAPGQTVTYGRLHTSYLPLPLDLQITLQDTPDPNNPQSLFLDVKTVKNEIIVTVRTGRSDRGNSSQALSIDATGAIYVF